MKKALQSVLNFLLFSNLFMALCAVAQGLVTFFLLGIKPNEAVLGLLFLATLAVYNFSLLVTKDTAAEKLNNVRLNWFFSHYRLMVTITLVASLSLIPLFFLLPLKISLLLIIPGIISVFYNIPLLSLKDSKSIGIRNLPLVKQLSIVLVWTVSCVFIPIMLAPSKPTVHILLLIVERALLYSIISIPFDIRDLTVDRIKGVKTIPVLWGETKARQLCILLIICYLIGLIAFSYQQFNKVFFAQLTHLILVIWFILKPNWQKNNYHYFLLIDGLLVLQYLLLLIFNLIK